MAKKNNKNRQTKNRNETNKVHEETQKTPEVNPKEYLEELNNNIDITPVSAQKEETTQENNVDITPSSSREDVEVDKIFKLLQEAKDELKNKNNFKKDRNERISKIINDMPVTIIQDEETQSENSNPKKVEEIEIIDASIIEKNSNTQKVLKSKKDSHIISYLLVLIIFILVFLLFDNNNIIKLNANTTHAVTTKDLQFIDLPTNIQNEFISKTTVMQAQVQTKDLLEKSKLLIDQNKLLEEQIESLKKKNVNEENTAKEKNVKNNRNLLKENDALKHEQNIYSNKVVALKISNKRNKEKIELLSGKNELLEKALVQLKQNQKVQAKATPVIAAVIAKESQEDRYKKIVDEEVFPAVKSTSKEYKVLKCYDLKPGQFYLTSKCKKDITQFVKVNKDALRFEIIGVVDQTDFTSLYEQDVKSEKALELQKYNTMGLARYRVLETSWFLSEQLEKVVLTPVNYTLTSKKTNRGSIIRAYYK